LKRIIAFVFAMVIFAAAWTTVGSGAIRRWLTLIGLLASERFAAVAMPRVARIVAARGSSISVLPSR
jgi:hypothetical protein